MNNYERRNRTMWSDKAKYNAIMHFERNPKASQKTYLENFNKQTENKKLIRTTLNTWLSPKIKALIIQRFEDNKNMNDEEEELMDINQDDGLNHDGKTDTAAGDGKTNVGDGKTNVGDGKTNAGDGETNASDGETNAGDGETNAGDGETDASDGKTDASDGKTDAGDAAVVTLTKSSITITKIINTNKKLVNFYFSIKNIYFIEFIIYFLKVNAQVTILPLPP
jgi:hypothetical protein